MKKWSIPLIVALVALLMPVSTAMVNAQGELSISKEADKTSASVGETITYTYTITNETDNVTISNIMLEDDKLGTISLNGSDNITLAPGDNVTATATYTVKETDLPGPLVNTATVSGIDPDGNTVTDNALVEVKLTYNKYLLTKATILRLSGVPGKGILKAPGLQKLFNPKSQAAEHAGKKDKDKKKEQNRMRQMTENHGTVEGQLKIEQKVKNQP
jgi:hypothetical protein